MGRIGSAVHLAKSGGVKQDDLPDSPNIGVSEIATDSVTKQKLFYASISMSATLHMLQVPENLMTPQFHQLDTTTKVIFKLI